MDERASQTIRRGGWLVFAAGCLTMLLALVAGLGQVSRTYTGVTVNAEAPRSLTEPFVPVIGTVEVDCGSPFHLADGGPTILQGGLQRDLCSGAAGERQTVAYLLVALAAALLLGPIPFLRSSEQDRAAIRSSSLVRRANQFVGTLVLLGLLALGALWLFAMIWGVKTEYGNQVPAEGIAKMTLPAAVALAILAIALLARSWCLHRWPDLTRTARHLLVLGAITMTVTVTLIATVTAYARIDPGNCWSGCDRSAQTM